MRAPTSSCEMQVRWSPEAAEDLERIVRLIQRDKPIAAKNTVLTLYRGIADLKNFPIAGAADVSRAHAS
jgi:plasmid stabilization system protein ParE